MVMIMVMTNANDDEFHSHKYDVHTFHHVHSNHVQKLGETLFALSVLQFSEDHQLASHKTRFFYTSSSSMLSNETLRMAKNFKILPYFCSLDHHHWQVCLNFHFQVYCPGENFEWSSLVSGGGGGRLGGGNYGIGYLGILNVKFIFEIRKFR